ncbi:uncharacterized protein TNCV_5087481 [Trichonephila clavipes]|nr:uncharacterized protein TNCV_5087481 [Trichonephila clavipes]
MHVSFVELKYTRIGSYGNRLSRKASQLTWLPKKTEVENHEFKVEWTENFAFIQNLNGPPTCLICKEKFAHNKKSNLERHFRRKHASFSTKYPTGDARKKAVEKLQKSQELSTFVFNNWMQSSSNINMASFVFSQEIAKRGPKEDFLGLLPFKGQTRGEDIANAVIECMDKHHIFLDKIVSISTDGAKSMTGVRKRAVIPSDITLCYQLENTKADIQRLTHLIYPEIQVDTVTRIPITRRGLTGTNFESQPGTSKQDSNTNPSATPSTNSNVTNLL